MTYVFCGFKECTFCQDWIEEEQVGICTNKCIILDNRVDDIFIGCPNAIWKDTEEDNE